MAESKGLPMTAKWDPEKLQRDTAELEALAKKPFLPRAAGYIKRTGPGLLQSAMTLGAGSATASVLAGASFGYKLLWVQPVAMFLGVMMLAALGNIVLSTGERPYKSFGRESSKILVFLWALGTIMASIIWHFPQYGLAAGAARDLASMAGVTVANAGGGGFTPAGYVVSFLIGGVILSINVFTVFSYGSSAKGIKLYEWFLRSVIALIVLMFAIVVIASAGRIQWLEVGKGFIGWYGIPGYQNTENVTLVLGMLGAAVGINMTFLYPYSLLAKGWGKSHKALSRWDLGMSMFLPFTLVTSLVIMAMAVTIHDGTDAVRAGLQPVAAAASLSGVLGESAGRIVFNLGLIAMTCTAISTHMVVCGFTFCEMFGLEYTKTRFRVFAMVPAVGLLGVVTTLPFWFPVAASAICFTMLPIAYLLFLILNNKASFLGDGMIKSPNRAIFNFILVIALAVSVIGAAIQINSRVIQNPQVRALFGVEPPAPAAPKVTSDPTPQPEEGLAPAGEPKPEESAPEGEEPAATSPDAGAAEQPKTEAKPEEKAEAPAEKKE